jgi:preprotein translocase subunit SecD
MVRLFDDRPGVLSDCRLHLRPRFRLAGLVVHVGSPFQGYQGGDLLLDGGLRIGVAVEGTDQGQCQGDRVDLAQEAELHAADGVVRFELERRVDRVHDPGPDQRDQHRDADQQGHRHVERDSGEQNGEFVGHRRAIAVQAGSS